MPRVHASDEKRFNLLKTIASKAVLDVAYRMRQCNIRELPPASTTDIWRLGVRTAPEKPRYIIIGIQKDKSGDKEKSCVIR